jgi:hypothetical protein
MLAAFSRGEGETQYLKVLDDASDLTRLGANFLEELGSISPMAYDGGDRQIAASSSCPTRRSTRSAWLQVQVSRAAEACCSSSISTRGGRGVNEVDPDASDQADCDGEFAKTFETVPEIRWGPVVPCRD